MRVKQRKCPEGFFFSDKIPDILQRIYAARGITDEAQLDKSLCGNAA